MTVIQVSADKETCTMSGMCVQRVPQVFDQDEDGAAEIIDPRPPADLWAAVRNAARECPTQSIRVE